MRTPWGEGEPIAARLLGPRERLLRWGLRNPIIAALGVAVALSLVSGSMVSLFFALQAANSAADARANAVEAANHAQIAETEKEKGSRSSFLRLLGAAARSRFLVTVHPKASKLGPC